MAHLLERGRHPASILEIIAPAGFEHFFEELSDIGGALNADPEALGELCQRYRLEMDPDSIPGLLERFDGDRRAPLGLVERLVRLGPLAGRYAQGDVSPPVLVQRVVRGDHGLVPGVGELLPPRAGGLEVVEVPDDVPVVVARVADLQLGEAVGMERVICDAEELAEFVAETHETQATPSPGCR